MIKIKQLLTQIKQRVNKMSLYWKTWVITAVTILLTLILFFTVFSLFATKFLEATQGRKFSQSIQQVYQSVQQEGVNETFLEEQMIKGVTVLIFNDDELVFPKYSTASVRTITSGVEVYAPATLAPEDTIVQFADSSSSYIPNLDASIWTDQRKIAYQGTNYEVEVSYPVAVNPEEIKSIFVSIIPYFLVIGLVVSFVISFLYARYFSRKITNLSTKVHQMATSSLAVDYQAREGDELQDLENNVHHMYQELQQTLRQLNQEVDTVKRLESDRQVFMRGATHELKTPIMAMTTMLEGMMQGIDGFDNHEEYLQKCYTRLQSMSRLVNEMLEVSKIESVVFTGETNLKQATDEVLELYDYMILDKELVVDSSEMTCSEINIPNNNLKKILSNLIGNAVKYTPEKGQIKIRVNRQLWEIRNQVSQTAGIEEAQIFSPFITLETETDNEFEKSHGLGLYIVATILKQYDYDFHWEVDHSTKAFIFKINLTTQNAVQLIDNC